MGGTEDLQVRKLWHLMQLEDPRAVGSEKDSTASMKVHSRNLGTPQLKELPAAQPPLPSCTPPSPHHTSLQYEDEPMKLLCHFRACELRSAFMFVNSVAQRRRGLFRAAVVGKCMDSSILSY